MLKNSTFKLIIFLGLLLGISNSVFAATLELNTEKKVLETNEVFVVSVLLNTEGQSINTIEGVLKYDSGFINGEAINISNSFVNFWIEKPNLKTPGLIRFSGITPGGISSQESEVFNVIFKTKKEGNRTFLLNDVRLFLNDGEGSELSSKIENLNIKITKDINTEEQANGISNDKIQPERFNIIRTKNEVMFDDKYFIVFDTSDKGSGVSHYEVCELFKCVSAESPFLLKNQTPFYFLKVKAYDMNGNYVLSSLTSTWFIFLIVVIFLIILYLVYLYRRKL